MAIAVMVRIERHRLGYRVPCQSHYGSCIVSTNDSRVCSCPNFDPPYSRASICRSIGTDYTPSDPAVSRRTWA